MIQSFCRNVLSFHKVLFFQQSKYMLENSNPYLFQSSHSRYYVNFTFLNVYPSLCTARCNVEILRLSPIQSSISDCSSYKYQSTFYLSKTSSYFRSLELRARGLPRNKEGVSTHPYFLNCWRTRLTVVLLIPKCFAI